MHNDEAAFLLNAVFVPALEREHPTTRRVIQAIPVDQGDYRPEPLAKSAIELAWHIVAAEKRFFEGIVSGGGCFFSPPPPPSVKKSVPPTPRGRGRFFFSFLLREH